MRKNRHTDKRRQNPEQHYPIGTIGTVSRAYENLGPTKNGN